MANDPPSLGDSAESKYMIVREKIELPKTRKEIMAAIENTLNLGGVQKIIVELGKPIHIERMMRSEEAPADLPDDDLFVAARNAPMQTVPFSSPLQAFALAFRMLRQESLEPMVLYVFSLQLFFARLNIDMPGRSTEGIEIFGVEVREHPEVPQDAALLLGVDDGIVLMSIRLEISQTPGAAPKKKGKM